MKRLPSAKRTEAFRFGLSAESRAALLLTAKGFRVLVRRWRSPVGEIDIVARRRIVAGAEAWLAAHPEHEGYDFRFDAILVAPGTLPEHIQAAFEVES